MSTNEHSSAETPTSDPNRGDERIDGPERGDDEHAHHITGTSLRERAKSDVRAYRQGHLVGGPTFALFFLIDLARALWFQYGHRRVSQRAAGVAFYLLFGFVPVILMLLVATEIVGLTHVVGEFIVNAVISTYFPVEKAKALHAITGWVEDLRTGFAGIGLIAVAYAALEAFNGIYMLVNDMWHLSPKGGFLHKIKAAIYCLFLVPIAFFASTILTSRFGGLRFIGPFAARLIALLLIFTIAFIILKVVIREHLRWRTTAVAALVGALAFEIGKAIFALYVHQIAGGSWVSVYGTIFLIPVFMLWNLVTAIIIAVAASLGWALQHPEDAFEQAGIQTPHIPSFLRTRAFAGAPARGALRDSDAKSGS